MIHDPKMEAEVFTITDQFALREDDAESYVLETIVNGRKIQLLANLDY